MPQSLVIIVSGGSRGLGRSLVERLLGQGHCVATFSRSRTQFIDQLMAGSDLEKRFYYEEVDATDVVSLRSFVQAVHGKFGQLDALINNAAIAHDGLLAMTSETDIQQMLDVNLRATFVLAKESSRLMLVQGAGCIIQISSVVAQVGYRGLSVYGATKAGLEGLTRSLARELGPRGIRVNAVAPGFLETDMSEGLSDSQREQIVRRTPLGRIGDASDIGPCIDFLLSPGADFITGQVITVDGGASV